MLPSSSSCEWCMMLFKMNRGEMVQVDVCAVDDPEDAIFESTRCTDVSSRTF